MANVIRHCLPSLSGSFYERCVLLFGKSYLYWPVELHLAEILPNGAVLQIVKQPQFFVKSFYQARAIFLVVVSPQNKKS